MKRDILDLYSDYLLSSFGQTTATGLAQLMDGAISHDQVTRMLSSPRMSSKEWWRLVKPQVRQVEREDGVIIVDDSIVEKPYTDETEIAWWHSLESLAGLSSLYPAFCELCDRSAFAGQASDQVVYS